MPYAMSRRRRNFFAAVFILAASAVFVLDHSCVSRRPDKPAKTVALQNSADVQKYHAKRFTVVKAVDGDTIDIDIPDANFPHTRIRLWGVDTPETKDPRTGPMYFGKEAADFTAKVTLGKQVTIFLDNEKNSRDKYHRLLAYVQLPDGSFLNERLLSEGYAYADSRFKHSFYYKYKQLESLARKQKKGLWANVTPDQMPRWRQKQESLTAETAEVNN
jgi:micrococcal nuclease